MKTCHYLFVFCTICCWAASAVAATSPVPDDNIHINADHMSQDTAEQMYIADGNVVVDWQGARMTSDKARYSAATHMLYATGSVVLTKGTAVLKGETLVMNTDTGRAEIDPGILTVPDSSMNINAGKLIRISDTSFTGESSELSTCDFPDPSWKFSSSTMNVNTQGYATGRNVIFYVKNVPVLYLPWLAFPVSKERRSGLLLPRYGTSTSRGVQLDLPIYWAISPSQDLQLDLDIMSRRGVGTGVDYRYLRSRESTGHVSFFQIYDKKDNRWRWQLDQNHTEVFSPNANLRMSINKSSDDTFLTDYGESSGDYNRQSNVSTINTLNTWQNYAFTSLSRYNENLYATGDNTTVQTLPSIGLGGVRHAIFSTPLYFDIDVSADNIYREAASRGQRLDLYPRVTMLPFKGGFLQTTLFAGAHVRGYSTGNLDSGSEIKSNALDLVPEAGVRVSTSLARIYNVDLSVLKKIRHEIIPEISYGYMPYQDQERLPFYDYTDRLIHKNMITLSATSLINGKFVAGDTAEYRDISRIKLSADYKISGERRDLLTLVESQRPWSDLILESETLLTKQLRITFDSRYNLYEHHLSTAVVGVDANDLQGNYIGAGYQMARNEVEYFEGRFKTNLIKPLNLSYTARYSFDSRNFLESVYVAEYRHKCWSVNFAVHQRPDNNSYTVNFNLAGLGS